MADNRHVDAGDVRMIREHELDGRKFLDLYLPAVRADGHGKREIRLPAEFINVWKVIAVWLVSKVKKPCEMTATAIHARRVFHGLVSLRIMPLIRYSRRSLSGQSFVLRREVRGENRIPANKIRRDQLFAKS
jgi:hypothetical protein